MDLHQRKFVMLPASFKGFLPPYPQRVLTEDETKLTLLLMMGETKEDGDDRVMEFFGELFAFKVHLKRIQHYGLPVSLHVIAWTASLCENTGQVVVFGYTLALIYQELMHPLTMKDLSMGYFADGVPDHKKKLDSITPLTAWDQLWVSQKGPEGQNLIDCSPWPSIPAVV